MNLIALLLALLIERAATHLFRLREPRWFDSYIEWTLGRFRELRGLALWLVTLLLVLLPVVPVAIVAQLFRETLLGLLYVAFATFVLMFSFGPRDLKDEVDDYLEALAREDRIAAASVAREIMEHDAAQRTGAGAQTLQEAIFVQANNRLFGVAFWFMIAGPAGAWLFRVSDLLRRRAVFEYRERAASPTQVPEFVEVLQSIHGLLAWVPARLLALGYALGGSFERALRAWRTGTPGSVRFFDANDDLLAAVGRAADESSADTEEVLPLAEAATIRSTLALVTRALVIWLVIASALVLIGVVR